MQFLFWTIGIVIGGFILFCLLLSVLEAFAPAEQRAKMQEERAKFQAEAKQRALPLKDRLNQAGHNTVKIYEVRKRGIALDVDGATIVLFNGEDAELQTKVIPFKDIKGATIDIRDNVTVKTSGGRSLTGAVVGVAIGGPVGAVIGGSGKATNSTEHRRILAVFLELWVDDIVNPIISVPFLKTDWGGLDQNSGEAIPAVREWKAVIDTIVSRKAA